MEKPKFIIETMELGSESGIITSETIFFEKDNRKVNLSFLVREKLTDYQMYDKEGRFVLATYKNFEDENRYAIVSVENDVLVMEDIMEIKSYIPEHGLFILELEEIDIDLAHEFKSLYDWDIRFESNPYCVVDAKGNYILKPWFYEITWKPEEGVFYAEEKVSETIGNGIYNVKGEKIGEFDL